jgi:hypothetical protein
MVMISGVGGSTTTPIPPYGHYSDKRLKEAVDMFDNAGYNLEKK